MSDQLKEGLLLHLQTNRNFVDEKVYKEFGKQCLKQHDISTLNRKKMKEVIKFIFDFGSNEDMKSFFQRLEKNIEDFINQEKETKSPNNKGNVPMDLENLVQLIIYCVNNGFQKPKPLPKIEQPKKIQPVVEKKKPQPIVQKITQKIPPKKEQPVKKEIPIIIKEQQVKKQQKKKPQITLLNPQLQAKVDRMKLVVKPIQPINVASKVSTRLQMDKIPVKVEFKLQKHQMPNLINVGPKYLQSTALKPKPQQQPIPMTYQPIDLQFLKSESNRKMMRQRLFNIFKHYCSQQQNKGQSATFDKIKSEMEHMTVGKFLIFCKSSDLFIDSKVINKDLLMNSFRKVAAGKNQIGFEEFQGLLKELDAKYIKEMKADGKSEKVTYEARLRLNSTQGYKDFKKWLNMVFFTRDNKNKDIKLFNSQLGNRDLTGHSGKFELDLLQQLSRIKLSQTIDAQNKSKKNNSNQKHENIKPRSRSRHNAMNLQEIHTKDWPRISWLQEEFKKDEFLSNEELFPKLAKRKDVVLNIKKRVEEVTRMETHR